MEHSTLCCFCKLKAFIFWRSVCLRWLFMFWLPGCGSGLSGETLTEHGHHWIGYDISKSMLGEQLSLFLSLRLVWHQSEKEMGIYRRRSFVDILVCYLLPFFITSNVLYRCCLGAWNRWPTTCRYGSGMRSFVPGTGFVSFRSRCVCVCQKPAGKCIDFTRVLYRVICDKLIHPW